jgi:TRAP-type C4-dicarboxylate transport system permease small subunit
MRLRSKWSKKVSESVEKSSLFFGYLCGGLVLFMMFSIVYDVLMRHIFRSPTIWADEVSCYLLVGITFMGAAYTLAVGGHILVEVIVESLPPLVRRRLELVTDSLTLAFLLIFCFQAYRLTIDSYLDQKIAPTLLRTPTFIPQLSMAIGLTLACFQFVVTAFLKSNKHNGRNENEISRTDDLSEDEGFKE